MLDIPGIVNRVATNVTPPKLPEPPKLPKPPVAAYQAKTSDFRQLGNIVRNRIENLFDSMNVCPSNNPGAAQIQQIARENAPLLVLPKSNSFVERLFENQFLPNASQNNLPADPLDYIANSRLREDVPFDPNPFSFSAGRDKGIGDNTNSDASDNFSASDVGDVTDERDFLDLNNDKRDTLGSQNAPVFYQFDAGNGAGEPPKLTYHFFYDYNDAPKAGVIDFNHEGDWERVTYELDPKTFAPVKATLSAHEGGETFDFKDLQFDAKTNRPLIYVANGSHANYATSGNHTIKVGGVPVTFDQTRRRSDATIFDASRNLRDVRAQDWYPSTDSKGLHWGEIGESEHSTGPQGPSASKGAV